MRLCIPGLALLALACRAAGEAATETVAKPPPAVFTIDVWPGEGIPVMQAVRTSLPLRTAPDLASPVIDVLGAEVGERVPFDSTRVETVIAGNILVTSALTVTARDMGPVRHISRDEYYGSHNDTSIALSPGATIEFLQHRAEGTCFVRIDGVVVDANPCPAFDAERVRVEREPVTRWWIGLRGQDDHFGWVLVSDTTVKAVRREF